MSEQKPMPVNRRWFYARHWLRAQVCRLRGHRLETGHHLSASLYCSRCGRIQFYYHREGKLIVAADATQEYLNKLGIRNPNAHPAPQCKQCGQFLDSRGKCRVPEHNL